MKIPITTIIEMYNPGKNTKKNSTPKITARTIMAISAYGGTVGTYPSTQGVSRNMIDTCVGRKSLSRSLCLFFMDLKPISHQNRWHQYRDKLLDQFCCNREIIHNTW